MSEPRKRRAKSGPPALVPRLVPVADLHEDPENARQHSERNIDAIVKSLRTFGQQKPIVISTDNVVRAGNGTLAAARRLGWTQINCVVTNLQTADELRAYAIADNRVGELSDFDDAVLAEQLRGILDASLVAAVGFDDAELADLQRSLMPSQREPSKSFVERKSGKLAQARVMLAVDEIATFEQALRATGCVRRSEALLTICRHFLDLIEPDETGAVRQSDAALESAIAASGLERRAA